MGFVFVPVYISYLGIEAYGLIGLFATLQAWLSLLDLGLSPTLNREMARLRGGAHTAESIRDLLRSVEIIYSATAIVIAAIVFFSSYWLASYWLHAEKLPLETVATALSITGLVIAFRWVSGLYRSALGGLQEQVWLNVSNVVFGTLRGAGVIAVLALVNDSINAFFMFQGALAAVEAVVLSAMVHRALPKGTRHGRFDLTALRKIARFAGGISGITFLTLLLTQLDKIVLSGTLALSDFGHYSLAAAVASALYMFVNPVAGAIGPKFAEIFARGRLEELAAAYHRYTQLTAISVLPPAIVLAMFSNDILSLWTGDVVLAKSTAHLVTIMVLGTMLNGLMTVPYFLQLAAGWTRFTFVTNLVALAFVLPAFLLIVPRVGAIGAASVWLALNIGYVLISVPFMHRRLLRGEANSWYLADVLSPLGGILAACTAVRVFVWVIPSSSALISVAAIVVAAILTELAGLATTSVGRELVLNLAQRLSPLFLKRGK